MRLRIAGMMVVMAALAVCGGRAAAVTNNAANSPGTGGVPGAGPDVTTTLGYHLATNAVGRTAGFTNALAAMAYLRNGPPAGFYQYATSYRAAWSPKCWLAGVRGLSATALGYALTNVQTDDGAAMFTMVSPRHYLAASHMTWSRFFHGHDAAVFLDTNNVVYYRKSLQLTNLGNEIAVGILDADLPASVGFLPLLPGNYTNWLAAGAPVEGIGVNQDCLLFGEALRFGGVGGIWYAGDIPVPFGLGTNWTSCADPAANCHLRRGDSSDPVRLLIGNELVLVSAATTGSSGTDYALASAQINQQMHYLSTNNGLATDYQLSFVGLTNWPALGSGR